PGPARPRRRRARAGRPARTRPLPGPTGRRPPPLAAARARRTAAARRGRDLRTAHPGRPARTGGTGTDALRNGHGGGGGHGGRGGHGGGGGHGGATGTSVGAGTADAEAGTDRRIGGRPTDGSEADRPTDRRPVPTEGGGPLTPRPSPRASRRGRTDRSAQSGEEVVLGHGGAGRVLDPHEGLHAHQLGEPLLAHLEEEDVPALAGRRRQRGELAAARRRGG